MLPGVTVEASSPALIEKVRVGVTDDAGQYRITNLNPGTYSLTFRLTGFNIVKREGIELSGTSTLTIPIDMRVGALEETITVTGDSPVVDVQSAQHETVLSSDIVAAMPGNRSVGTLLNTVPGLNVNDGALAASPTMTFFAARGGPINEGRMAINGMTIAAPFNGGGVSTYILDSVNVDEVSVAVAGGLGESDIGGPVMNLVPRSGGNQFRGSAFINNAGDWSRGNNLTPELTAPAPGPNLAETPGIINSYDASVSYGGPIKRDRLWFFGSYRSLETAAAVPGVVLNANAYNASRWDWVADPTVTARTLQGRESYIGRITMQVSAKHRVSYNQEYQRRCEGSTLQARKRQRLQHARRRLGRVGSGCNHSVTRGQSELLRQPSVSRQPGDMDGADDEQAPARGGLHPLHVPRRNDGPAGARWHHEHDPGDRAVHGDQSVDGSAVCAARELRLSRGGDRQPELRQPEQLACLGLVRHGLA